ncbi:bifunctional CTLH-CRA C-terminal to LisH motif domain/CTLH [Babesia duncani]|uniref:Bifunctional CTLH-CRA C-terminal to LisH motif domain/CTLH n=1 Tax=Babesia duncani TaxID=323732 RepID=A0AAD9PLV6_9APIC|nr:bifunctional CTLH-CRA C-terminal to LisH motif domain/CTLH [Babesia duncani]
MAVPSTNITEEGNDVAKYTNCSPEPNSETSADVRRCVEQLCNLEVSEDDLKCVVLNHLYTWMYKESFETFLQEARLNDVYNDKLKISQRREIHQSILKGDLNHAVELVNGLDPLILKKNYEILFGMKLFQLFGLIKNGHVIEAAQFARHEMPQCLQNDPKLFEKLERAMSLVTFPDLSAPEAMEIINTIETAQEVSKKLDTIIMEHFNLHPISILDCIVKEALWAEAKAESMGVNMKLKLTNIERCGFSKKQ